MVDALSRQYDSTLFAISAPATELLDRVKHSWTSDERIQHLIADLEHDPLSHKHYSWANGILKRKGKLVVGDTPDLCAELVHQFHEDATGRHSGVTPTYH